MFCILLTLKFFDINRQQGLKKEVLNLSELLSNPLLQNFQKSTLTNMVKFNISLCINFLMVDFKE